MDKVALQAAADELKGSVTETTGKIVGDAKLADGKTESKT